MKFEADTYFFWVYFGSEKNNKEICSKENFNDSFLFRQECK